MSTPKQVEAYPIQWLPRIESISGRVILNEASRFWGTWNNIIVAVVTMGVSFATGCLPVGFVAGWITHVLLIRAIQGEPQMRSSLLLSLAFLEKGR